MTASVSLELVSKGSISELTASGTRIVAFRTNTRIARYTLLLVRAYVLKAANALWGGGSRHKNSGIKLVAEPGAHLPAQLR